MNFAINYFMQWLPLIPRTFIMGMFGLAIALIVIQIAIFILKIVL